MHVIVLWVAAAITSEYDGGDAFLCTFFTIRSATTIKSDIVHKRAARVLPLELFNASLFLLCGKPFITKRSRSFPATDHRELDRVALTFAWEASPTHDLLPTVLKPPLRIGA